MLNERFPDYDIVIEYIPTGENVARVLNEGQNTECDILFDIEQNFMNKLLNRDILADVGSYDTSMFVDDFQPQSNEYLPWSRFSACIGLNLDVLKQRGLDEPSTWEDLLKGEYKNLLSMPSPKTSGTGYIFLKFLANKLGEDEAFGYFDFLAANVLQFTASGAGPTNALLQGEVAIGLGMTYQMAAEIEKGANLKIIFFEGGAPHSSTANGIIKKSAERACVKEVMAFIYDEILEVDNMEFMPEHGLKISKNNNPYFPAVIYGDMGENSLEQKEKLLARWKY
jgi:iron(III) transport system substrate-binding protein